MSNKVYKGIQQIVDSRITHFFYRIIHKGLAKESTLVHFSVLPNYLLSNWRITNQEMFFTPSARIMVAFRYMIYAYLVLLYQVWMLAGRALGQVLNWHACIECSIVLVGQQCMHPDIDRSVSESISTLRPKHHIRCNV